MICTKCGCRIDDGEKVVVEMCGRLDNSLCIADQCSNRTGLIFVGHIEHDICPGTKIKKEGD